MLGATPGGGTEGSRVHFGRELGASTLQVLDSDGSGSLNFREFKAACRSHLGRNLMPGPLGGGGRGGEKMEKTGGLGGGLLRVACSGFYVHLKSVFPLIRF